MDGSILIFRLFIIQIMGFGPFGMHPVNASWECVKLLASDGLGDGVQLFVYELPVEYKTVKENVAKLWDEHKPDLVVHMGVSSMAREITLEQQAHNTGYVKHDIHGCAAEDECCVAGADSSIVGGLDMRCVCEYVNSSGMKAKAVISYDAGRYLCDFSYYTSLHIDRCRSAFIHVPPLGEPYTLEELVEGVKCAILAMLAQLS